MPLIELANGALLKPSPKVAERAGYKCEYCDLDLLEPVMHYWLIEVDHIVPKSKMEGDPEKIDNLAFSCRTCNVNLK
jgi:5-methylcytosine-specific restriction endonuclease McrA